MIEFRSEFEMDLAQKEKIRDGLIELLESGQVSGSQKEQRIQDYFESNSELLKVSNTYKNYFHQDMLLSKCPVGGLKSDYVYLTKKSDKWKIVFGEFELPDHNFFKKGSNDFTAEFNHALQQVQQWRLHVERNRKEVIEFFEMLYQPPGMRENPTEFGFELIFGRSHDKNLTRDRKGLVALTSECYGIDIMSYDSVINNFMDQYRVSRKNAVSFNGKIIRYKKLNVFPTWDFSVYNHEQIVLTSAQRELLISSGVDLNAWEEGGKLGEDGKVRPTIDQLFGRMRGRRL